MLRASPLLLLLGSLPALAAPGLRHTEEVRGDMILIGNTLAHECRYAPAPVVGTVGACGNNSNDSGVDIFWRSDSPTVGSATAVNTYNSGRSKAVLALPAGATGGAMTTGVAGGGISTTGAKPPAKAGAATSAATAARERRDII